MIEIQELSLRYGPQIIFDQITAHIEPSDRIGLAGRNGAGKTSFLRAILGLTEVDGGKITVGKQMSMGYLPQDGIEAGGKALIDEVMEAEGSVNVLNNQVQEAYRLVDSLEESEVEKSAEIWNTIHQLEEELELLGAKKLRPRTEKILHGLGFENKDFARNTQEFSGGWLMRIALAKLLLQEPHYLFLDEPTNHLDLPSQRWLEGFLGNYPGGIVMISHDRAFLDSLTRRTFALGDGSLEIYNGNYSYFEKQQIERKAQLIAKKDSQDRQIKKTQQFVDRFRAKASKATQVQSRIKQLEKIEKIEIESEQQTMFFRFPPSPRSNQEVLSVQGLHKAYGELELFDQFDLKVERGHRLAVVGKNGAGKSTLARILAGEESFQAGKRVVGEKTEIAYFAQQQTEILDPNHSVLDSALSVPGANEQAARDLLGSFLFTGDSVRKSVKVLSGGEKNRLALARMLLKPANLIILDEPTNHLDIQSKAILQDALKHYDGSFLIISHDRDFLDPLVDQTLEINPKGHRLFWCNVSGYLEKVEVEEASAPSLPKAQPVSKNLQNPKELRRQKAELLARLKPFKNELSACESRIENLESRIAEVEQQMTDPGFYSEPEHVDKLKSYQENKLELDSLMERWEKLHSKIEKGEKKIEGLVG